MTARYPFTMLFASDAIPDDELVRRASSGDRAAFEELYHRNARLVHAILLARVPISDAEDLVQDVFLSAFRKMRLLRVPGAFRGWLMAIARNRATEFHRSAHRDTQSRPTPSAEPRWGHEEAAIAVDAIRKLPEAYRETLILRLVEGMTGPEIAERTGLTPESVRVNLSRGMKMLREHLGVKP